MQRGQRYNIRVEPLDILIKTVLSQNTTDKNSDRAFAILKKRFSGWDTVRRSNPKRIAEAIRSGGLANIKAKRIKEILTEIYKREGRLSLDFLRRWDTGWARDYLRSLKGVGPKTASCVLLFALERPVMPVDTHIFRVTRRLGWIPKESSIECAHILLTELVPAKSILPLHLLLIEHGRKVCVAGRPRCQICRIRRYCKYYRENGVTSIFHWCYNYRKNRGDPIFS